MIYIPSLRSPADSEAAQPIVLGSPLRVPGREPLRHILVGSRTGVEQAVQQLHALTYAEQFQWSQPIIVPETGITITPVQGEVLQYLIRWRSVG
ncbi:hypothetical protein [Pseudanabaena sp. FACHB-2040]|uniref:hypothetical protein n=1 Tax=Pseudanabaena sp. FACHB-2040 TaxID=2692859 RepID=UPI001681E41C|nr:hypothetical protein [Pseudanabaena sp. FACHB-2040]MBD2260709.1 hypothetical protein [Pseudanabaena sp. FACHB-2040]